MSLSHEMSQEIHFRSLDCELPILTHGRSLWTSTFFFKNANFVKFTWNDIDVFYFSEFHHWIIWMVDNNRRMSESSITSKSLRFWKSIWTRCLEKWNTVKWPEINGRSRDQTGWSKDQTGRYKDQTRRSKWLKNNCSQDHRRMKVDGRAWQKLRPWPSIIMRMIFKVSLKTSAVFWSPSFICFNRPLWTKPLNCFKLKMVFCKKNYGG